MEKINIKNYILRNKKSFLFLLILVVLYSVVNLLLPQIVEKYIDSINLNLYNITFIALIYLLCVFIRMILLIIITYISEKAGCRASNKLKLKLFEHLLSLDYNYHKKNTSGDIIEQLEGDVGIVSKLFSTLVVNIIGSFILLIGIIVVFYRENNILGALYLIISFLVIVIFKAFQKYISNLWLKAREKESKIIGYINENISGIKDIIGLGKELYSTKSLSILLEENKRLNDKASFLGNIPSTIFFSMLNIGEVIGLAIGIYLYYSTNGNIGSIYVITSYIALLEIPFLSMRSEFAEIQKISAALKRLNIMYDEKSDVLWGNKCLDKNPISIQVNNMSFSYGTQKTLNDVSFSVKKGQVIGVVGKTGSGKSTLLQLLSKMYQYKSGEIKFNGININQLDKKDFYRNVYMVSQNMNLLNDTIRNNLLCFSIKKSDEELISAIKRYGLGEWFQKQEKGLDTIIDSNTLSIGERQLLLLVRAHFVDCSLLLFDEITTHIDDETEKLVFNAMQNLLKEKTAIIVLHKLNTLKLVDKILILRAGEVQRFSNKNDVSVEYIKECLE